MAVLTSTPERRIKHRNQATASAHSIPSKIYLNKNLFNFTEEYYPFIKHSISKYPYSYALFIADILLSYILFSV
nr:MAG TPA: hypothetical protein [Caudoviricetes sp.]